MTYNLTSLQNVSNPLQVVQIVNAASNQWFGVLVLLAIFIMSFMLFKKEDSYLDFMAASFITSIVGGLMFFAGLLTWGVVIVPVLLLVVSFIFYILFL